MFLNIVGWKMVGMLDDVARMVNFVPPKVQSWGRELFLCEVWQEYLRT
jgi:hypothetical protein